MLHDPHVEPTRSRSPRPLAPTSTFRRSRSQPLDSGAARRSHVLPSPRRRPRTGLALFLLLVATAASDARAEPAVFITKTASAAPTLAFDTSAVTVEGVTPGGEVALLGIVRTRVRHTYTQLDRVEMEEVDLDEDGVVRFELEHEIAPLAAFAVVDVATGLASVAGPGELKLEEIRPQERRFVGARADALEIDRRRLSLLWIRPGAARGSSGSTSGVWRLHARDGTADDEKPGADGRVVASTAAFKPAGRNPKPPPRAFSAGDTLVAIDDRMLTFSLFRFENDGGKEETR